ncbi:uncharacterized protein FOMMEDRAFT_22098 [Fomitiporia mediterranea MF3/22]|uniref:uncharacterized protein n=1 Tax=Fomitiporia mediterranea (strain MF3/22) TaxID=694068 RepID=UPI00044085B2|nr:uncharacterized protein FOMMEDRAFT_22098 [Fomitiporia mediterranea MF3/22]EJD01750.1 hypothetical protein FOMMEDRAFT_22098 [Fomitiporia mediterranea MF3/22]
MSSGCTVRQDLVRAQPVQRPQNVSVAYPVSEPIYFSCCVIRTYAYKLTSFDSSVGTNVIAAIDRDNDITQATSATRLRICFMVHFLCLGKLCKAML